MKIGLYREIKSEEYRVGLSPAGAHEYVSHGHQVLVESGAGVGSGFTDEDYQDQGCTILSKQEIAGKAEMIIKVKEPLPQEYQYFREGIILYTYLHLAANPELTKILMERNITGVGYETVMEADGSLPLLKPMSEIAGRLAVQEGAKYLEKSFGGRGILLGGVPGIRPGKIMIIGGGVVGRNACKIATGLGAEVTILDVSAARLAYLDDIFGSSVTTLYSTKSNLDASLKEADLVICAVLRPGAAAPKLVKRDHLRQMKKGAVIVDVAVDQGGCTETTRATTHQDPIYVVDDIVHYCVANMPGVVALSATQALTSVTNRYGLQIAASGIEKAMKSSSAIRKGVNTWKGRCVNREVAEAVEVSYGGGELDNET